MTNTKVVTGKCRLSYANLFEARAQAEGQEPKYSVTLLIPKSDTKTVEKINAAIKAAREVFVARNGAASLPAQPKHTFHDGDGLRPSGDPFSPECKGHYVITVSNKNKPVVVDLAKNEITDPSVVYSGCYARAAINFYGYNTNGNKGISASLLSVQKIADGEPFGIVGSANDFDDDYDYMDELENDYDFM